MTSNDKSKLLDKIEKLMKLGASPNPAEAAAAINKAQQLMAEHNLNNHDLVANQIGEVEIRSTQSVSKPKDWEVRLISLVGKSFGCRVLWKKGYSHNADYWGRFILVGPKSQLQLAEYAAVYLIRQLVKARAEFGKSLRGYGMTRQRKTEQLDGYAKGWIAAISVKLIAFTNAPEVETAIQQKFDGIKSIKADNRGAGMLGTQSGFLDGKEVQLHRPMNQGQEPKQLAN